MSDKTNDLLRFVARMIAAVWVACVCFAFLPFFFPDDEGKPTTGEFLPKTSSLVLLVRKESTSH